MPYVEDTRVPGRVIEERPPLVRDLVAGAIAGQISGLAMAAVALVAFPLLLGLPPWLFAQATGALLFGEAALEGLHVPSLVAGVVLHLLGPSLFWGLVLATAARFFGAREDSGLVVLGVAVGALALAVDVGLVLPALYGLLHETDVWAEAVPVPLSVLLHLVYGAALASFAPVWARLGPAFEPVERDRPF